MVLYGSMGSFDVFFDGFLGFFLMDPSFLDDDHHTLIKSGSIVIMILP